MRPMTYSTVNGNPLAIRVRVSGRINVANPGVIVRTATMGFIARIVSFILRDRASIPNSLWKGEVVRLSGVEVWIVELYAGAGSGRSKSVSRGPVN